MNPLEITMLVLLIGIIFVLSWHGNKIIKQNDDLKEELSKKKAELQLSLRTLPIDALQVGERYAAIGYVEQFNFGDIPPVYIVVTDSDFRERFLLLTHPDLTSDLIEALKLIKSSGKGNYVVFERKDNNQIQIIQR